MGLKGIAQKEMTNTQHMLAAKLQAYKDPTLVATNVTSKLLSQHT